jgi:hypothetical protein
MTTNNISHSLNALPFLSEEMERTLRLRAWKDEIFREALIADPKGVIQRLFPQSFPDGKVPEELTIKVIEEDLDIYHVVFPFLPDECPILEIPEEEHLELLVNMAAADRLPRRTDSSDQRESENTKQPDLTRDSFKRRQAGENKENNPVSGDHQDSRRSENRLTKQEFQRIVEKAYQDKDLLQMVKTNPDQAKQMFLQKYLPNYDLSVKVIQDTADIRHLVLPKLPDASHDPAIPEGRQLGPDSKWCNHSKGCGGGGGGSGTKKKSCK